MVRRLSFNRIYLLPYWLLCCALGLTAATTSAANTGKLSEEAFDIYRMPLKELIKLKTISISTGTETNLEKAPSIAAVISREEIDTMMAATVYDVLETVAGLHVYPTGFNRLNAKFSIRGIHTNENPQVLVLINGQRQSMVYSGTRWNLFNLGVDLIERIEIIRGPNSAIYGADAFAGVINIITRGVDSAQQTLSGINLGSFDTQSVWVSSTDKLDELAYSFNAQWRDTQGDHSRVIESDYADAIGLSAISLAPGPLDTYLETTDIRLQLRYQDFELDLSWLENKGGTGAGASQALSDGDIDEVRVFSAEVSKSWQIGQDWQLDWSASYQTFDEYIRFIVMPPGMMLPRRFDQQGQPTAFTLFTDGLIGEPILHDSFFNTQLVSQFDDGGDHQIRLAVGMRKEMEKADQNKNFGPGVLDGSEAVVGDTLVNLRGTPYIYIFDHDRRLYYVTIQDEWRLNSAWDVVLGARYDRYSDFGSTFNPRAALVWSVQSDLTVKWLYGEAFRPPSFQELYTINNPVIKGNPELNPEKLKMFEYAMDYRIGSQWQLQLGLFSYRATDMIDWVAVEQGPSISMNIGHQQGHGIEFEGIWKPSSSWLLSLGYSWQQVEDADSGLEVAEAPAQTIDLMINWRVTGKVNWRIDSHWISDRIRAVNDPRASIDDYIMTNMALHYEFDQYTRFKLAIKNVFNVDARAPASTDIYHDLPLERRGLWLDVSYRF